jgi:hypothetical protein
VSWAPVSPRSLYRQLCVSISVSADPAVVTTTDRSPSVLTKVRDRIDNWRFWITAYGVALGLMMVGLYALNNRQVHEQSIRTASMRAASVSQVASCFTDVKNTPITKGFIDSHESLIENSLISTRAALRLTQRADPLYAIRTNSLRRLNRAKRNVIELKRLLLKDRPTMAKCVTLAKNLHVDASRYLKK